MFIDINYNKRPQKAKFQLAKPNKVVTSSIYEKFKDTMGLKLGNISELSFSIPHYIEGEGELIKNPHVDEIKEKMLIKVTLGTLKEWFIVDSIEEDSSDNNTFNVTAFSLGYELKGKRISGFESESINLTELMTELLKGTTWKIGTIDASFNAMYRSFSSGDDSNVLECISNASETFGALIEWDSNTRKVSFKDPTKLKTFKGMTVSYGRLLGSVKRTRTTDEMVTRLWVYGNEDLTIHSVNPTGEGYLEDFSYFMYPFKRDANRNVIASSHFMSDALCHAILDHQNLISIHAPNIKTYTQELLEKQTELIDEESKLVDLKAELINLQQLLDVANKAEDTTAIAQRKAERNSKQTEVNEQEGVILVLKNDILTLEHNLDLMQQDISSQANFTQELLDELSFYVIESTWRDSNYIKAQELYDDALKKFSELREPKVVIDISIENLMNIIEEQYYWDKLNLGDLIKVKYEQMGIEYMAKIIEINYDLENGEAQLTVANTTDLLNDAEKLLQLLKMNNTATSTVNNSKYKWDKVNAVAEDVSSLLTSEWDATKNKIIAGVNNSVEVGNRGIIIKNPDFPDEVVIMQSGVIALSMDGGETWKTAIKPDGIVAERLIGKIIAGQELIITNSGGLFTFDNTGMRIKASAFVVESGSGTNLVEKWQGTTNFVDEYKDDGIITDFEKKMIKKEFEKIQTRYNSNVQKLQTYYDDAGASLDFVTQYHSLYQQLYDYLFVTPMGDKPMLDPTNMASSTRIDRNVFDNKFKDYDTQQVEVEKQILLKAKSRTDEAIKDVQDNIDEVMDDVVWKIELTSPNGTVFRNGIINTTITAKVYRGKDDITSTLSNSQFIWTKRDRNGVLDNAWNTAHVGVGKTITVTGDDVYQRAIFQCDIDIP